MARKNSRVYIKLIVLLVAVVASKCYFKSDGGGDGFVFERSGRSSGGNIGEKVLGSLDAESQQGDYHVLKNCRLKSHKHNDGDSFHVRLEDGRDQEFRLYFVDAPESALKTYRGGETNEDRLRDQSKYFELKDIDKTVRIGKAAKAWVLETLEEGPFTVYTAWDLVYGGPRAYAFVEIHNRGSKRFIHELLVERGLARIHTQKADLPNGRSQGSQLSKLRSYEREAKRAKRGAWSLR